MQRVEKKTQLLYCRQTRYELRGQHGAFEAGEDGQKAMGEEALVVHYEVRQDFGISSE